MMFNQDLDCCAWGGSTYLNLDGQSRMYRITWLPPWSYKNQGPIAHEMGHGFGLPHSSGPYGATYDSRWDVMSDVWGNCPPVSPTPTYGCVGTHTIPTTRTFWDGSRATGAMSRRWGQARRSRSSRSTSSRPAAT